MIDQISGSSGLFIIIILVFFSGELVWRDRDVQINEVIDSTPHSSLVPLFSKALSLLSLSILIHFSLVFVTIIYQLAMGYTEIEFSLYLKDFIYNLFPFYFATCAAVVAIQVIVNNKYIGYVVSVIVLLVLDIILLVLDISSNMISFTATPYMIYSDLNGFGPSNIGVFWFSVYWMLFAMFLFTLSGFIWNRGAVKSFKERLNGFKSNITKPYVIIVSLSLIHI